MSDLVFEKHSATGRITSVKLYGTELLNASEDGQTDLRVNGLPLKTRRYPDPARGASEDWRERLKGEHFVDHFSGWGLVLQRDIGGRDNGGQMPFNCVGINYLIRREQ
ncbi:MAG TPA: hypothetical protein VNA25_00645, partial [Phycisphaerae bacterium]|nr:hypothetical protein [Phycisphaerae bacterium]